MTKVRIELTADTMSKYCSAVELLGPNRIYYLVVTVAPAVIVPAVYVGDALIITFVPVVE